MGVKELRSLSIVLNLMFFCQLGVAKQLNFDEAVKISLENNHDLKSIRDQANSLKYKSAQNLAPNSPVLGYQKNDISGFDPSAQSASETISLSYTLNFPGKSISQSRMYKHQAEFFREDAFGHEVALMNLLYINMSNQYANSELIKTLTGEIKKTKDIILIQEKKFSTGQVGQVDILNSRESLIRFSLKQKLIIFLGVLGLIGLGT